MLIWRRRMSDAAAFALQASMLVTFLAASITPTPLYPAYQSQWGMSSAVVSQVFAIYAIAVLATLLTVGALSDHIGRRPMMMAAILLQLLALAVFLLASGVEALFLARGIQGISTGAALGAVGGGLLDLNREKGTLANALAAMAGTALGALVASLFVAFLPAPTHLIYALWFVLLVLQGVAVRFMRETVSPRAGALGSLIPNLKIPSSARMPFLVAIPTFIAVQAMFGFYGALGPAVTRALSGSSSAVLGGLSVCLLTAAGGVAIFCTRGLAPIRLQAGGAVGLICGVAITEVALASSSLTLLIIGIAIVGTGMGTAFQGALRTVLPLATTHERSGLVSSVFVACYLAMAVPAVIAGVMATNGEIITTARIFGVAVMLLAAAPLVAIVVRTTSARRQRESSQTSV